ELLVLVPAELRWADAVVEVPLHPLRAPLVEGAELLAGLHEVLHLHLLELAHPEDELPGDDLVAKSLADLRDPEGHLEAGRLADVLVLHEDALRGLGPEVDLALRVRGRADVRLEHQVELADVRPVERAG